MNDAIREIIKQIPATQYGAALKVFLDDQLEKIDSVDGLKTIEDVKARQIAKQMIKDIFAFYPQGVLDKKNKRLYN